jgi:hypothetical protein
MKKTLLILLLTAFALSAWSQKKTLIEDKDQIHAQAIAELEQAMTAPEGSIYLYAQEHGLKGEYTYDLTIREKGDVATVFAHGHNNGHLHMQNKMKDFLMEFQFNFKVPKGKNYKIKYTFKFE